MATIMTNCAKIAIRQRRRFVRARDRARCVVARRVSRDSSRLNRLAAVVATTLSRDESRETRISLLRSLHTYLVSLLILSCSVIALFIGPRLERVATHRVSRGSNQVRVGRRAQPDALVNPLLPALDTRTRQAHAGNGRAQMLTEHLHRALLPVLLAAPLAPLVE